MASAHANDKIYQLVSGYVCTDRTDRDGALSQSIQAHHHLVNARGTARLDIDARGPERIEQVMLGRCLPRELMEIGEQRLTGIVRVRVGLGSFGQVRESMYDDGFDERFLRREVSVQGPDPDACPFGNDVNRYRDAFDREDLLGGLENARPISEGVGSHRSRFLDGDAGR